MTSLAGPDQPRPPGWRSHQHVQRFTLAAPRESVGGWLADPATFTGTQVPPWRVEFLEHSRKRLTLTRHGEAVAVMISAEDLAGLEDTVDLLRTPVRAAAVDEGITDVEAGRLHDQDDILADLQRRRDDS